MTNTWQFTHLDPSKVNFISIIKLRLKNSIRFNGGFTVSVDQQFRFASFCFVFKVPEQKKGTEKKWSLHRHLSDMYHLTPQSRLFRDKINFDIKADNFGANCVSHCYMDLNARPPAHSLSSPAMHFKSKKISHYVRIMFNYSKLWN